MEDGLGQRQPRKAGSWQIGAWRASLAAQVLFPV